MASVNQYLLPREKLMPEGECDNMGFRLARVSPSFSCLWSLFSLGILRPPICHSMEQQLESVTCQYAVSFHFISASPTHILFSQHQPHPDVKTALELQYPSPSPMAFSTETSLENFTSDASSTAVSCKQPPCKTKFLLILFWSFVVTLWHLFPIHVLDLEGI